MHFERTNLKRKEVSIPRARYNIIWYLGELYNVSIVVVNSFAWLLCYIKCITNISSTAAARLFLIIEATQLQRHLMATFVYKFK